MSLWDLNLAQSFYSYWNPLWSRPTKSTLWKNSSPSFYLMKYGITFKIRESFSPDKFFWTCNQSPRLFCGGITSCPIVTRLFGSNILSQNLLPSTKSSVFKSIKVIYSRFSPKIGLQITQKVKCPNYVRWTVLNVWISRTGYLGHALVFTCRTWSGN